MSGHPSFPELWARVPSRERTDRTKVLLGLYALGAKPSGSVQRAGDVAAFLRLQLRNRCPANTSDALRKAGAAVEPIAEGSGLVWRLTNTGMSELHKYGARDDAWVEAVAPQPRADIAVLCALRKPELSAVFSAFGGQKSWTDIELKSATHVYHECSVPALNGSDLRVVATTASSMGLTASAIATSQLISIFKPRLVVMVGIAAGAYAKDREYGDILVPDPSVDYASGKVIESGGIQEFQPDPYPLPLDARLRALLLGYKNNDAPLHEIRDAWDGRKPSRAPTVHVGPVGAADQVVDAESVIQRVQKSWRKLIGIEMETYGLYRAVHEAPHPRPLCVAFKSVCDFATKKSDDWQAYAAYTAASFARYFVSRHWADILSLNPGN